jgi:hypothetical protein
MFGKDHETVAFGNIEGIAQGLIDTFKNGLAVASGLAAPQ